MTPTETKGREARSGLEEDGADEADLDESDVIKSAPEIEAYRSAVHHKVASIARPPSMLMRVHLRHGIEIRVYDP
jgi:hypothetical protein